VTFIAAGSLLLAPQNPDDYPTFVSADGTVYAPPTNDPLFNTDALGTVTNGVIALDSGRICVTNLGNFQIGVFNADMTSRAVNAGYDPRSIAGGYDTAYFYGIQDFGSPFKVQKFDSNDASLVDEWSMGTSSFDEMALAVAKDDSYAYFARTTSGTADIIRLNLSAETTSTFISAAGRRVSGTNGMFCRRDLSLVVAWDDGTIIHYDTSGSVVHTYTRANVVSISPGMTDTNFWAAYTVTGVRWMQRITVSSGALEKNWALPDDGTGVTADHTGSGAGFLWGQTFTVVRVGIDAPAAPGTPPAVTFVNSTPCCDTGAGPTGTVTPNAGPVLQGFGWTPQCTGGGAVPTATALTDSENWDT
jgi:hypothetical protein